MNESRKVIAFFEHAIGRDGVAFPLVRAWLRDVNICTTENLAGQFPDRGTIFVHLSACGGREPGRNQFALFDCAPSNRGKACWMATHVRQSLANVIDGPDLASAPSFTSFWQWLTQPRDLPLCEIFPGPGVIYVRRGNALIGPFMRAPSGALDGGTEVATHEGVAPVKLVVGGHWRWLVDTSDLGPGKPLIVNPRLAVSRLLKPIRDAHQVDWLSRHKIQDLGKILAKAALIPGCEWVREELLTVLGGMADAGEFDEMMADAVLGVPAVEIKVRQLWERTHSEIVSGAQKEREGAEAQLRGIRGQSTAARVELEDLQAKVDETRRLLAQQNDEMGRMRTAAAAAFDAELRRLAESPASLALIGAWTSRCGVGGATTDPGYRMRRVVVGGIERVADLAKAVSQNLRLCGVAPKLLPELSTVIRAAVHGGQAITIRSGIGDMLAEAIAVGSGVGPTIWVDTPAGLLEPIDWAEALGTDANECAVILQSANRSDLGLVLGTMRDGIVRGTLGRGTGRRLVILVLESRPSMTVEDGDLPPGPVIDDRLLFLRSPTAPGAMVAWNGTEGMCARRELSDGEEFASEVGQTVAELPLFASASRSVILRACFEGIRGVLGPRHPDLARLFFKYWCVPRVPPGVSSGVCLAHKDKWASDELLSKMALGCGSDEE